METQPIKSQVESNTADQSQVDDNTPNQSQVDGNTADQSLLTDNWAVVGVWRQPVFSAEILTDLS